ncbi:MAG: hypothetical protein D6741_13150 [Planctomycetota bacterium]|nr:MAG: hypothetical protein D6741_13150 [Planctomycetota bacterium]
MKSTWWIVCVAIGIGTAGCRARPEITALEQENFALENRIYQLADHLEQAHAALEACKAENAKLRAQQGLPSGESPAVEIPTSPEAPTAPNVSLPKIELPDHETPPEEALKNLGAGPDVDDGAAVSRSGDIARTEYRSPVTPGSTKVTALALDPRKTTGFEEDGRPGDDGIAFVLRPFDADGNLLLAPAEISVVVLDPSLPGLSSRIARWDLSRDEVRRLLVDATNAGGIPLRLRWPAEPPVHRALRLYVRYTTDDGRRLQAESPLNVDVVEYPDPPGMPPAPLATSPAKPLPHEPRRLPQAATPETTPNREASAPDSTASPEATSEPSESPAPLLFAPQVDASDPAIRPTEPPVLPVPAEADTANTATPAAFHEAAGSTKEAPSDAADGWRRAAR